MTDITQSTLPRGVFAFMLHFMKKEPWAFAVFFAAPSLMIIDAVVLPYVLKMVIDAFTITEHRDQIWEVIAPALWIGASAWLALLGLLRLQEWWQVTVLPRFEANMRMAMTDYLLDHSYTYFTNRLSGSLVNKINDIPSSLDRLGMNLRWNVVGTLFVAVAILAVVTTVAPIFSWILGVWIVTEVSVSLLLVRYVNNASAINAEDRTQLTGRIVDVISNIMATKLFARKAHDIKHILEAQQVEQRSNEKLKVMVNYYRLSMDVVTTLMWGVMGYFLVSFWQQDRITTGDLVFLFNVIWALMFRLWFLGESLATMFSDVGIVKQALEVIHVPHSITDAPDASKLNVSKGEITFDRVTFRYQRNNNVFENKSVTIAAGSRVGLVGFSGSGKTTFVHLILRFFEIERGRILIDGQDIAKVTQDSLHESISMIPQDISLYHRSLMDNIRVGRPSASDEEVIEVAKRAHCDEFIRRLPDGYFTLVGERGVKLSGGQRQRVAIARAMLKNAPILILDEATSALDSVTERHIQESLDELMTGRTTIVIAHRLSTLSHMDRILVFDQGRIVEDGSHMELLDQNGHYDRMWQMQAGGFLPEREGEE